jgi:hypothetical protein
MVETIELKKIICNCIIDKLELDLQGMTDAHQAAADQAKSEDFKAESKWDTRAIEAGYLAGAQNRRVKELEIELINLKNLKNSVRELTNVAIGALVKANGCCYFITTQSGGFKVEVNNRLYSVISINSPIANKLLEDEIEIESII